MKNGKKLLLIIPIVFLVLTLFTVSASNIILDPSFELNDNTWSNATTNGGLINQSSTAKNQSGLASGMTSTLNTTTGSSTSALYQALNRPVIDFNFTNSFSWWTYWNANASNGTIDCYTKIKSSASNNLIYWYNLNKAPPVNDSTNVYLTITNPTWQTWNQTQRNLWTDWNKTANFSDTENITEVRAVCEGNLTQTCLGTLNCPAGLNNYTKCTTCNQCLFAYASCAGTLDCSRWNNNESGCNGAPVGACNYLAPNCNTLQPDCAGGRI